MTQASQLPKTAAGAARNRDGGVNRRSFIGLTSGLATVVALNEVERIGPASARTKPSDIVMMDGVSLARAIKSKQVSCVEVMNAYLDHIERLNPRVNAIVSLQDREGLLKQAKGRDEQLARSDYGLDARYSAGHQGSCRDQRYPDDPRVAIVQG
jgi:hypothetical protein